MTATPFPMPFDTASLHTDNAAYFLCMDEAARITGVAMDVLGGRSI